MSFQLYNDGACIRIERTLPSNEVKTLMLSKEQVRTIDIIKETIIRIDIGEGPLKNIYINHQDVTIPVAVDANELRTLINAMMNSEIHDLSLAKEATQQNVLMQLQSIATGVINLLQQETDFSLVNPSRVDESNPNMIYRGWHALYGVPSDPEWAIERITRINDEEVREWAFGLKRQNYIWNNRAALPYAPWDHDLPVPAPLP